MVRHTEPDREFDDMDTDDLAAYVNRVAPVAANLPEGEYAEPVLRANAEAAIAEFRSRHGIDADDRDHLTGGDREPSEDEVEWGESVDAFEGAVADAVATDGGKKTVEGVVDEEWGDEPHYLRHVTEDDYTFSIRHDGHVDTDVVDGVIVHKVTEQFSDDAHGDSIRFTQGSYTCPIHGPAEAESERDHPEDADMKTVRYTCTADGCPYEAVAGQKAGVEYGTPDYERPLFFRATVPHDFEADEDFDAERFESIADAADHDDEDGRAGVANVMRKIRLRRHTNTVHDDAYVKAEYDDDMNKTADAYLDTFECARCGDEYDAGAERSHPHFGTVCPSCEDATVWSVDDADLPDDVTDRMNDHKTFSASNIVALLRDVKHYPNYVARLSNDSDGGMFGIDEDDVDPEDVAPIHTGKQGRRSMGRGDWERGTGLRRSTDGVFNGMSNWRTLLSDAVDTGLIARADDADDVADEDTNARWSTTDKGEDVWSELARCETCGGELKAYANKSHYQAGRRSESSVSLVTKCPTCDDKSFGGKGDSTTSQAVRLPGVTYGDE